MTLTKKTKLRLLSAALAATVTAFIAVDARAGEKFNLHYVMIGLHECDRDYPIPDGARYKFLNSKDEVSDFRAFEEYDAAVEKGPAAVDKWCMKIKQQAAHEFLHGEYN